MPFPVSPHSVSHIELCHKKITKIRNKNDFHSALFDFDFDTRVRKKSNNLSLPFLFYIQNTHNDTFCIPQGDFQLDNNHEISFYPNIPIVLCKE
jgi:hypothetical protein